MFKGVITPKHYIFNNPDILPERGTHRPFNAICLENFIYKTDTPIRQTGYNQEQFIEITDRIDKYIPSNRLEEFYRVFDSLSDVEEQYASL